MIKNSGIQFFYIIGFVFLFVVVHLYLTVTSLVDNSIKNDSKKEFEQSEDNKVRLVIVDQHQEVIPHWYQAADDGLIGRTKNTLIHIDAHSDLAPPDSFNVLKDFNASIPASKNNFLPLMTYNDAFIISSILHNFITQVVWIIPSWTEESLASDFMKSYMGTLKNNVICYCQILIRTKQDTVDNDYECYTISRADGELTNIEQSNCKPKRAFLYVRCNENNYQKYLKLNRTKNVILDIDEDYYGVESGYQNMIDKGLTFEIIQQLDDVLQNVFCPKSLKDEELLNKKIKSMFLEFSNILKENNRMHLTKFVVKEKLTTLVKGYECGKYKQTYIEYTADIIEDYNYETLKALSKVTYCNTNSYKLERESEFILCHGTIEPSQSLNEIHISNETEILKRNTKTEEILNYIYKYQNVKFITMARSLRDGYIPRFQQRFIEKTLLGTLEKVLSTKDKSLDVIYDEHMIFGKDGWSDEDNTLGF